jgi:predicted flap endonuclease-1-like 5' DNA nuclease
MSYKIDEIQGIGPAYRDKLTAAGVATTDDLLAHCADAAGRKKMAAKTGLSEATLLKWTNLADLMRISGVGPQFSELLEGAGVDTVKELRTRNAANLAVKMAEVNAQKKLARVAPPEATIAKWIEAAKKLEPRVTH